MAARVCNNFLEEDGFSCPRTKSNQIGFIVLLLHTLTVAVAYLPFNKWIILFYSGTAWPFFVGTIGGKIKIFGQYLDFTRSVEGREGVEGNLPPKSRLLKISKFCFVLEWVYLQVYVNVSGKFCINNLLNEFRRYKYKPKILLFLYISKRGDMLIFLFTFWPKKPAPDAQPNTLYYNFGRTHFEINVAKRKAKVALLHWENANAGKLALENFVTNNAIGQNRRKFN